jgi:predicted transport protein
MRPGNFEFSDHLKYTESDIRPILLDLRARLPKTATEVVTSEQRIAYRIGLRRQFLEVKVQKHAILVRFKRTIVPDERNLLTEVPKSHKWTSDQQIRITDRDTLEYAMRFITAACERGGY